MMSQMARTPRKVSQDTAKERGTKVQGFRDRAGNQLPLTAKINELGAGGVAVALYFYTNWAMIFVFLIAFAINLPALANNWKINADKSWAMRMSLGFYSKWEPDQMITYQAWPSMLVAFLFIGFLIWLDRKEALVATEVDRGYITSSDFAVEVRNIPLGHSDERELKAYFSNYGKVHTLAVAYKSSKFIAAQKKWEAKNFERHDLLGVIDQKEEKDNIDHENRAKLSKIHEQLAEIEAELKTIQNEQKKPTGVAFCVFQTEKMRMKCLDDHKSTLYRWLLNKVTFGCLGQGPKYLKKFTLDVTAAPEPSDINWQNLHYTRAEVQARGFRTLVASTVLIALSGVFFVAFEHWSDEEVEYLERTKTQAEADRYGQILSIAVPVVVTIVNFALSYLIGVLTNYEHRYTKTDFERSLFFKVALTIVINQSLLGLFVEPDPHAWWSNSGGVMTDSLYNCISNFQPELQKFIQPELVVSRYVVARWAASQKKADRAWEPAEASLGEFYAGLTTITALGIIYGPAMPICYLITAVALFMCYLANKYTLLRVFKNPPMLNGGLSDIFANYVAFLLLCSLCLQYVIYGGLDDDSAASKAGVPGFPIAALVFLAIYVFVPLPCFRPKPTDEASSKSTTFEKETGLPNYDCPVSGPLPSFRDEEKAEALADAKKPLGRKGSMKYERQLSALAMQKKATKRQMTVRMPWSSKGKKQQQQLL